MRKVGDNSLVVRSPRAARPSRDLPIVLQLSGDTIANPNIYIAYIPDTQLYTNTEQTFDYLDDPRFTDIQPRSHLIVSVSQSVSQHVCIDIHNRFTQINSHANSH